MDSIEIVTSDEQVAGETAAVFERIARGLRKLERLALAFRHLRCVDNARRYRLFRLCAGFRGDLSFRCFERRFHTNRLSFRAKSRNPAEERWVPQRDVSTSLDMTNKLLLIKFCPITRMFLQYFAWSKFLFSSGQPFQFIDGPLNSKVFRKSQRAAAERRKTGS